MLKTKLYLQKHLKIYVTLTIIFLFVMAFATLSILTYQNSSAQLKKKIELMEKNSRIVLVQTELAKEKILGNLEIDKSKILLLFCGFRPRPALASSACRSCAT
jgi:hypothetical protein